MEWYKALKARLARAMEDWGYSAIGLFILVAVPAGLYYAYFTRVSAKDLFEVSGTLKSSRSVDEMNGDDRIIYFETVLEGLAVPVRFHDPVFEPGEASAPLKAPPPLKPGSRVTVHVAEEDRAYLATPQLYPPSRWVEGYSLAVDGGSLLSPEAAVGMWQKDRRLALYLANAFVIAIAGLLLFFPLQALETALAKKRRGPPEAKNAAPRPDPGTASRVSCFYYAFIPGLFFLNLPALAWCDIYGWSFGLKYWLVFAAAAEALQALFFLHHRRYLGIIDSKPLLEGEEPAGFFSYLSLTVILCFMLTPAIQLLYMELFGAGGR